MSQSAPSSAAMLPEWQTVSFFQPGEVVRGWCGVALLGWVKLLVDGRLTRSTRLTRSFGCLLTLPGSPCPTRLSLPCRMRCGIDVWWWALGGAGSPLAGRLCWRWRICAKGETYADLAVGFGVGTTTVFGYIREALDVLAALAPTLRDAVSVAGRKAFVIVRDRGRDVAAHRPGRDVLWSGPAVLLRETQVPWGERAGDRGPGRPVDLGLARAAGCPPRHGRCPRARHPRRSARGRDTGDCG